MTTPKQHDTAQVKAVIEALEKLVVAPVGVNLTGLQQLGAAF